MREEFQNQWVIVLTFDGTMQHPPQTRDDYGWDHSGFLTCPEVTETGGWIGNSRAPYSGFRVLVHAANDREAVLIARTKQGDHKSANPELCEKALDSQQWASASGHLFDFPGDVPLEWWTWDPKIESRTRYAELQVTLTEVLP